MTVRALLVLALLLHIFGCAASERFTKRPDPVEGLRSELDRILADSVFDATIASIKVYSPDHDEILYERGSRQLLRPASNMKILTSLGAIMLLSPEFEFTTAVVTDTIYRGGSAVGDLYIKGGGNSELRTSHLDTLAKHIARSGIQAIRGDIVADNAHFDTTSFGKGWMWDDEPFSFGAPISALSLNKNCVRIVVTPGSTAGAASTVTIEPSTPYVTVISTVRTVSDSVRQQLKIARRFDDRQNTISIDGEMLIGSRPHTELVSVWRPDLYAATVFKGLLERAGVRVEGGVRSGRAPKRAPVLVRHSAPLDSLLFSVNKMSDNLSAETLLRTLATAVDSTNRTAERGIVEINRAIISLGLDTARYLQADGSGVSHYNLISAETMVALLTGIVNQPEVFSRLYETLPIAGIDGTLSSRMKGTRAEGNVRAKTGTMSGISTLSGYATSMDGERIVFSIFMQNFIGSSRRYRDLQDAICVRLAEFTRARIDISSP